MSYYFVIVGTKDKPLFEYEFGTSKSGGDGISQFREDARRLNQFIIHSSLDIAEEVQWTTGAMYFRTIDRFYNSHISLFHTGARAKFLLLQNPDPSSPTTTHLFPFRTTINPIMSTSNPIIRPGSATTTKSSSTSTFTTSGTSSKRNTVSSVAHNPTSPQAEEAIRQFFAEVYENWVKACMSPFYLIDVEVKSPVFRQRVAAAARKYL